ncbi:hypothetical protein ABZ615_33950 [Streptomyces sp. NPDC007325]|uniref:hypothetical protein n=1 Tax=Streptomyces sp. NPDC007325 TaxID=3154588 RepID=UPI0033E79C10
MSLYLRSRGVPGALAVVLAAVAAAWLLAPEDGSPHARVPVVMAPLLVAAAIGTSLHTASDELDRTAVRAWWPLRLGHVLVPVAAAAALFVLVLPGDPAEAEFGASAAVRNTLGLTGLAAGAAALVGARASWLPPVTYTAAVWLTPPDAGAAAWWGWALRPAAEGPAWTVACALLCAGTALFARRGPRPGRG